MAPQLDRHIVTAVLVTHDGARWLPETLKALLTQSRPVDRLVAADTGSTDAGSAMLTEVVGEGNLITLPARTRYADAVTAALAHPASTVEVPEGAPGVDRVEWVWLIHDDSAPAPDALERLLTTAEAHPPATVLGPKLRDWDDRRVLLEAGVAIDRTGRRETGLDPREFDQGQHDTIREVMGVSTAGMLVRRDVWDELGGLDPAFGLFRDDVDFGWRAYAAGHRVLIAPDAVAFHAEATARGARRVAFPADDRRSALLVLLANLPLSALALSLPIIVVTSFLRAAFFAAAKRPGAAGRELTALRGALFRAPRLRRARRPGLTASGVNRFQPRWPTLRRLPDVFVGRGATLPSPEPGALYRWLRRPGVVMTLALTLVALVAERHIIATGGRIGGGALVPAWGGASDLWAEYLTGWHPVGLGSGAGAPPYAGVLAALATLLLGKPWLAVLVILVAGVPLAGLTAYTAARRLRGLAVPVAVWAGVTYALLPVATGAVATGRLGTIVVIVLLPLIGVFATGTLTTPSRHAPWAAGLLLAVAMAFAPLTWALAVLVGLPARYALAGHRPYAGRRLAVALGVPPLLLLPWTLHLLAHPSGFLREAGPRAAVARPQAGALVMLSPGGPGAPVFWVTAGLAATGLAALLLRRRRTAVLAGWLLTIIGMLVAILVLTRPEWPGVALTFAAAGVVLAAASMLRVAATKLRAPGLMPRAGAAVVLAAAASTPLLAAALWAVHGAHGALARANPEEFPLVVESHVTRPRFLILSSRTDGAVGATVVRERSPIPGEETAEPPAPARRRLRAAVAGLTSGTGGASALSRLGVGYVLVPDPGHDPLTGALDAVPDLQRLGRTSGFGLWQPVTPSGRLMLVDGRTVTPLAAGPIDAKVRIPPGPAGRTLLLAEPAGAGWHAAIGGHAARSRTLDGWAQAYDVPASGGTFTLRRGMLLRHLWVAVQGVALLLVVVLALPSAAWVERPRGRRRRGGHARTTKTKDQPRVQAMSGVES
ncbi:glycosyltransferase family 2 protein [Actinoallomurus iriomotensis]|uniref:Integral membrane regulatory protein n=1 Tax=Actinoallomurus iriomotensis TaxID=478107 RepID=A0A9W6S8N9_9ACTN|nr:glycosyltransferase family 2 protein [Actinoallomurus iriomotensis]GLY89118.1 integral membrane regulatory protein [Actinoallomurus iriomotensis]